ncbi:hypothetical protein ACO1O0_000142 [Amphichorda felina]
MIRAPRTCQDSSALKISQTRSSSPEVAAPSQRIPETQATSRPANPVDPSAIPSHQGVNHDEGEISSQESIPLDDSISEEDDTWGVVDPSEPWVGDNYSRHSRPRASHSTPMATGLSQESVHLDHDDLETVFIDSDDSDIGWEGENQPVDYNLPFDHPIRHETYPFEQDYPNAAPILRYIFALPQARRGAVIVRAMRGQTTTTLAEVARHLEQAVVMGRVVVNGTVVRAQDLAIRLQERWAFWRPVLLEEIWDMAATFDGRTTVRRDGRWR